MEERERDVTERLRGEESLFFSHREMSVNPQGLTFVSSPSYLAVFQYLCFLTFSLLPPDLGFSSLCLCVPLTVIHFCTSSFHVVLLSSSHCIPIFPPSLPSVPLIPCRLYGFMMHGNLTANTFICPFFLLRSPSLFLFSSSSSSCSAGL